ncbi:hypothetical protein JZO70_17975 [Enterococcus sp. 669A]|uniref:SpoVT-AbrB domain-containing protein n=1 Tax=Candidatus Enterococcus moelleringii TaxID=2815325 RepID=A0ABS3LEM1_9ENTE|nr:hypothetical protein [Enterococcus sp. 669A]MBO1308069.1 hypothetical protein [Enterococcus sp. 669A]
MELSKDKGKIAELADGKGVLLSKEILLAAGLENKEDVMMTVEVDDVGKKRIIIEEESVDKETLLDELIGIVQLPQDFDRNEARTERMQHRMAK